MSRLQLITTHGIQMSLFRLTETRENELKGKSKGFSSTPSCKPQIEAEFHPLHRRVETAPQPVRDIFQGVGGSFTDASASSERT